MTTEELKQLRDLAAKSRPFPADGEPVPWEEMSPEDRDRVIYNGEFFVAAWQAMPELVDEILACRGEA